MIDKPKIETILKANGYDDFKWTSGAEVPVQQWVRFKCMYGCSSYGKTATCPPAVPSIPECREFFASYQAIVVIHLHVQFEQPDDRKAWSRHKNLELLRLEQAAFLAGYPKAFLLFMDECRLCATCDGTRLDCKNPAQARPCPEALGVDVFSTVRQLGFPIEVLTDYAQAMNRYAFLLVE
jgi:predicted metal-binding protein